MAKDSMKSKDGSQTQGYSPISEAEIGAAYRALSNEHVQLRSGVTPQAQAALSGSIWDKIEKRKDQAKRDTQVGPGNLLPLFGQGRVAGGAQRLSVSARQSRVWVVAAACAAAALGGLYLGGSAPELGSESQSDLRVSFEVEGTTLGPDQAGQGRLIASENGPVGIRLSDKSQINLQPHTTLRLAALSDGVVITRMAQGTLDAEVVHQNHTNYQFFAGPYLVKVIGTAFRLSYEPEGQSLDLKMRSGVVEVVDADGESQTVRGGESLHLEENHEFPKEESVSIDELSGDEVIDDSQDESIDIGAGSESPRVGVPSKKGSSTDFRDLAARGQFSDIVRIAEERGIAALLTSASAGQLQELAQAARYTGRFELAEQVWLKMSARFSGSLSGHNAVFFLGRLDEQRGRASSAFARYESYLRSSPQGVYAQEAWGRKLQLSQKVRGRDETRGIAQQYIKRFPSGPFAASAKSIVDDSPGK